jgi:hypothetical protein
MALLEPTNLQLLACALLYGLVGEPADGLLLLGGGGLVGILGDRHSSATAAGVLLGVGLWCLVMVLPPLQRALALAPLHGSDLLRVLATTAGALMLAAWAERAAASEP